MGICYQPCVHVLVRLIRVAHSITEHTSFEPLCVHQSRLHRYPQKSKLR